MRVSVLHSVTNIEIGLEPFNFEKITAILGINDAKQNWKNGEHDDMDIGDGYLQEMSRVRMDEYEMACAEGSASEEELEAMRNNQMCIRDRDGDDMVVAYGEEIGALLLDNGLADEITVTTVPVLDVYKRQLLTAVSWRTGRA